MENKRRAAVNAIRKTTERMEGYELYKAIEKNLDLKRMEFGGYKLYPDAIGALAEAYKKLNDNQKETIFREFEEFLSVVAQGRGLLSPMVLTCDLFCEFLDSYIVTDSIERIEMLQKIYERDGKFKLLLDEYYLWLVDSRSISPLEYLYVKAMITKDEDFSR